MHGEGKGKAEAMASRKRSWYESMDADMDGAMEWSPELISIVPAMIKIHSLIIIPSHLMPLNY